MPIFKPSFRCVPDLSGQFGLQNRTQRRLFSFGLTRVRPRRPPYRGARILPRAPPTYTAAHAWTRRMAPARDSWAAWCPGCLESGCGRDMHGAAGAQQLFGPRGRPSRAHSGRARVLDRGVPNRCRPLRPLSPPPLLPPCCPPRPLFTAAFGLVAVAQLRDYRLPDPPPPPPPSPSVDRGHSPHLLWLRNLLRG